jgi:short-subunit dehydrogenase
MLHAELARETSPIAVSVVCPGGVRTDMLPPPTDTPDADDDIARLQRERYANSVSAEFVADLIVEAFDSKPLYVLTHSETIDWVRSRGDGMLGDLRKSALMAARPRE